MKVNKQVNQLKPTKSILSVLYPLDKDFWKKTFFRLKSGEWQLILGVFSL